MMRDKLYTSLNQSYLNQLLTSWKASLQPLTPEKEYFPSALIIKTSLLSKWTINHEPIKKKLKPGIDHDNLLIRCVSYVTKVDWSITKEFKNVPLLPSGPYFQALENLIRNKKALGPLLHFSGILPYIMNSQTQQDCPLQKKYREYPPASWPHAFFCANKCQNKYSKEGREDECSSIIYIAESCIPTDACNADFVKWVKNQPEIYILDRN
jgi:hypothetical protein